MIKNIVTYGDWLDNWVLVYKKPYIKSWKRLKANIRLHVPERVKRCRLNDLSILDIQLALNNVESSRMRLEVYDIYHGSLTMAYNLELIQRDIARLLVKPKHVRKVGKALSCSELELLLSSYNCTKLQEYYYFLAHTGCRRSEALSLLWSDIDFDKGLIHIRGTKTDCSDRYIPLFDNVRVLLQVIKLSSHSKRVFNYSPGYVSRKFSKILPEHRLHDLRHTFATRCLECGISLKVVQMWLGHSKLDTTAMIYSHVMPEFASSEANKFSLIK